MRPARSAPLAALAAAFALVAAHPAVARACPVCFDPRAENQEAFLSMTIFMSLLPLAMFGGLVLWIRRRAAARSSGP